MQVAQKHKKWFLLIFALILSMMASLAMPANAKNQDALAAFLGNWRSSGDAFGRPAETDLSFEHALNGQFVRLNYEIKSKRADTIKTIFTGVAYYKQLDANTLKAFWVDSTGDLHPITATLSGRVLVSHWGGAGPKLGRTQYELIKPGEMVVTDWVLKNEKWHQFNKNTFLRQSEDTQADERNAKNITP